MKVTVICNPQAGRGNREAALEPALEVLREAGWELTVRFTTGPGHATTLADEAASAGADGVVVVAGDGTLNEAVQSLAGTRTALGYLPFGTVNIWARELGLPMNLVEAARALVDCRIELADLGRAGDRYFLRMAGVGGDGEVLRRARHIERYKRRFSTLPYAAAALSTVPLYRGADLELRYDGLIRRVQALQLVVGNTRIYAGRLHFTPHAIANDGRLDVCIVKGKGPLALVRQALPLVALGSVKFSDVELLRVRELSVQTDLDLAMQLDGELAGSTPVRFTVASRALRAIVPRTLHSDLFD